MELDAVVIALPNGLHWPAVDSALKAGIKNILLEKPIADTVEDAQNIINACHEAGANLLVGHQRRSSATMLFLKKFIADGNLGDIVGIQCSEIYAKPDSYFTGWHTESGPLLINAIHDVDDLHYITGMKVKRVYVASRNSIRHGKIADSASCRFSNMKKDQRVRSLFPMALLVLGDMTWLLRKCTLSIAITVRTVCVCLVQRVLSVSLTWTSITTCLSATDGLSLYNVSISRLVVLIPQQQRSITLSIFVRGARPFLVALARRVLLH